MGYLEMREITKTFPGVVALNKINFSAEKGEVHAIAGENGAGKSTLIKVLSGAHQADSGEIWLDGKKVTIKNPKHGRELGIMVIYQELSLVPTTSIAENIFLGGLINKAGFIDRKEMNRRAKETLEEIGFGYLDPNQIVGKLSIVEQQAVEISKIIVENSKIVVMDEPTALLPPDQVQTLFKIMDTLKEKGITQTCARELGPFGITANAVCPGPVATSMNVRENDWSAAIQGITPEKAKQDLIDAIPLGRLTAPEDVANCVAFLAGQESNYINGAKITVTGGMEA